MRRPTPSQGAAPRGATARRLLSSLVVLGLTAAGLAVIVPSLLGFHLYAIATGSMTGTLDIGTLAVSREVPVDDLAVGDVITYVPPPATGIGHPVTHRIVSIEPDPALGGTVTYVTKGDANATADPWSFQLAGSTQARVEHAVPALGHVVLWLGDPGKRMLAIGIPAVLIALLSLRDLVVALRPVRRPAAAAVEAQPSEPPPTVADDLEIVLDLDLLVFPGGDLDREGAALMATRPVGP